MRGTTAKRRGNTAQGRGVGGWRRDYGLSGTGISLGTYSLSSTRGEHTTPMNVSPIPAPAPPAIADTALLSRHPALPWSRQATPPLASIDYKGGGPSRRSSELLRRTAATALHSNAFIHPHYVSTCTSSSLITKLVKMSLNRLAITSTADLSVAAARSPEDRVHCHC